MDALSSFVMKIEMGGIGVLPDLEINLEGMVVIAGINGTGKSTILKTIYSVLGRAADYDDIVDTDIRTNLMFLSGRRSSIRRNMSDEDCDFDYDAIIKQLEESIETNSPFHGRLESVKQLVYNRDDEKVYGTIIKNSMNREFGEVEQVRRIGSDSEAYFNCVDSDLLKCIVDQREKVRFHGEFRNVPRVVYYDSPFNADSVYDSSRTMIFAGYKYHNHRSMLASFLEMDGDTDIISSDMNDSNLEAFDSAVEQAIGGKFVKTERGLRYRTHDGADLNIQNVAAGAKVFAIIRKLVDNGTITRGSILMLDEPEVHLHPLWINVLAECLKIMVHRIGVRVILTTHNPQLLMALESDAKDGGMTRFYHLVRNQNGEISFDDVTADLRPVYDEMSSPIQDIASRFWE